MSVTKLGEPPRISVEVVSDHGTVGDGFLRVRRRDLRNRYPDGSESSVYPYFLVERDLLDAVVVVLYRKTPTGPEVILRSQLRPPLAFRAEYEVPMPALGTGSVQWEMPAGLCEPGERGEPGLFERASAEALEEVGYRIAPTRFEMLGPPASLSPGLLAEKLFFVCAEVLDEDVREHALGDGHAVEEHSVSTFVSIAEAVSALERGLVHDVKTEVSVFRIARKLGAL